MHSDLKMVEDILGVKSNNGNYSCGDLKMFYSYYNRDKSTQLPYGYPGRNNNTASDFLLNQIAKENTTFSGKICSNSHYKRVFNRDARNYFRDETNLVSPPLRENFYCNTEGLTIDRIRIGCRTTGNFASDNLEAF